LWITIQDLLSEIAKLTETSAEEIICHFKSIFARHGIPDELITDNGPQFSASRVPTGDDTPSLDDDSN